MEPVFDKFANVYGSFHDSPVSKYFFEPALLHLLGDVTGKSVLCLGCGEGYYSRLLKQRGASRVIGVDISPRMIEAAKRHEAANPLGIEYITSDMVTIGQGMKFDFVCMVLVLMFAKDKQHLSKMCQAAFDHMQICGTLVAITCIPQPPRDNYIFQDLGIEIVNSGTKNGELSASVQLRSTHDPEVEVVFLSTEVTMFTAETYENCLEEAGFFRTEIKPIAVMSDPVGQYDVNLLKDVCESNVYQSIVCMKLC